MQTNKLNEALKEKERRERQGKESTGGPMKLDDTQRVKVLSPSALVFKRFRRNKLAIVGSCILVFMFLFAFVGPLLYPYGQTQIFYKYDHVTTTYAGASVRTSYTGYKLPESGISVSDTVIRKMNTSITALESSGEASNTILDGDTVYTLSSGGDKIYLLSVEAPVARISGGGTQIAVYNRVDGVKLSGENPGEGFAEAAEAAVKDKAESFEFGGASYTLQKLDKITTAIMASGAGIEYAAAAPGGEFEAQLAAALESGATAFTADGIAYSIAETSAGTTVTGAGNGSCAMVFSTLVLNAHEAGREFSEDFKIKALLAASDGSAFEEDGTQYRVVLEEDGWSVYSGDTEVAMLSDIAIRDARGNDSFDLGFKTAMQTVIQEMQAANLKSRSFNYSLPVRISETDENGNEYMVYSKDENGNQIYEDTEITVTLKTGQYVATCPQLRHLIDLNASPSAEHIFGTDGDGMDILARMMYGGRISLMVGFVVVILETLIGVVMGGIAGYFGGWVDNLIMRLVDIFNCIPSMPVLIIMGALLDALKISAYVRLIYMMAVLGILGWASVARLVRGQILSLREQEFMVATEATGLKVRRRIFRHLVPNVMPQLIVSATAGLGSVILTESTLSFLGLGVKHPLATWGTMINSVTSSNENMIRFTYIWIPVGLLICLTVVAFNFVGDGLRDAFDPKMKR